MSTRVETSETITGDKRVETITRIDDKRVTEEITKTYSSNIPRLNGSHLINAEYTTHEYLTRCPDVLLKTTTTVQELLPSRTVGSETPEEATEVSYKSRTVKERTVENVYEGSSRYVLKRKITVETDYSEALVTPAADGAFTFAYTRPQILVTLEEWNDLGDGLTQFRRVKSVPNRRVAFTPNAETLTLTPSGILGYDTLELHSELSYEPPPTATCRGSGRSADEEREEEPREDLERENTEPTRRSSTVTFPGDAPSDDPNNPRPSTFPIVSNPGDPSDSFGSADSIDPFDDGTTPAVPTPKKADGSPALSGGDTSSANDNSAYVFRQADEANNLVKRTESDLDKKQGLPGKRSPRQVKEDAVDLTGARGVPILPKTATTGIERVTSPLLTMCTMDDRRAVRALAAQIEQEAMYARKGASVTVSERQRGIAGFVWGDDVKKVGIQADGQLTLTVEREGQ